MCGCVYAEVSDTDVAARFSAIISAKFGHKPLCRGAFVAGVSGTAVPAHFFSNGLHMPLATRMLNAQVPGMAVPAYFSAWPLECQMLGVLGTAVPARFSALFVHTPWGAGEV